MFMNVLSFLPQFTLSLSLLAILPFAAFAALAATGTSNSPVPNNPVLEASATTSKDWLELVDKGQYGESWNQASALMKMTVHKDEWVTLMEKTRKPLGAVRSRTVVDQRTAKNPHGLPAGDYMVMFYKTDFSGKSGAYELVTLFFQDGKWFVLTYQIDQGKI
jgi:Protein of unknown function (DUF4019)